MKTCELAWNKMKGIWRLSWGSSCNCFKPRNINPSCRASTLRNWSKRLKATATGTPALLASSMTWIKAQLSLICWSLNIQYTTRPSSDGLDCSFKTLIHLGGCTDDDNLFVEEEMEAIDDEGIAAKRTGLLTCARSVGKCKCLDLDLDLDLDFLFLLF